MSVDPSDYVLIMCSEFLLVSNVDISEYVLTTCSEFLIALTVTTPASS